jgi:hypothetical protein
MNTACCILVFQHSSSSPAYNFAGLDVLDTIVDGLFRPRKHIRSRVIPKRWAGQGSEKRYCFPERGAWDAEQYCLKWRPWFIITPGKHGSYLASPRLATLLFRRFFQNATQNVWTLEQKSGMSAKRQLSQCHTGMSG